MFSYELFYYVSDLVKFLNEKHIQPNKLITVEYQNNSHQWVVIYTQ